jgi:hypothetical protein
VTNNLIEVLEGKINLEVNYNTTNPIGVFYRIAKAFWKKLLMS